MVACNTFYFSDLSESLKSYRYLTRASSPLSTHDVTQRVRQEALINRFNDVFSIDRLNAMDTLSRYQSDYEMNQRICNAVVQVSSLVDIAVSYDAIGTLDSSYISLCFYSICTCISFLKDVRHVCRRHL